MEQAVEPKHVCGQCEQEFATEEAYVEHKCAKTGFTPADVEHFGPEFEEVSAAAQERGAERSAAQDELLPPDLPIAG